MLFPIFFALILGVLAGTITGLLPGIHINLISTVLLSSPIIILLSPLTATTFIVSMAITHTFIDFIPSVYFGAPDEDTALGVLPGHEFLMKGKGHEAIRLTLIGSALSILLLIFLIPLLFFFLPKIYPFVKKMMAFILFWIAIFLLSKEKKKVIATGIFLLAGFLGTATLNLPIKQPLLPLLTGLFGSSALIYSISKKTKPPEQIIEKLEMSWKELIKPAIITTIISPACSILPGLGSSQAAVIGSEILPSKNKMTRNQFLILLGSINTLVMATSFMTLILIQKSRTGAASALSQIVSNPPISLIFGVIFVSSIISIPLGLLLSKKLSKYLHKINYSLFSIIILVFLVFIAFIFSGILGLFVFITATTLGILCIEMKCKRGLLMGALLIPTILIYIPW
jgi:putative membrane protein